MGKFFEPWRKKLGVTALLASCIFATLWIRSSYIADFISFSTPAYPYISIKSQFGAVECAWFSTIDGTPQFRWSSFGLNPKNSVSYSTSQDLYWWDHPVMTSGTRTVHYGTLFGIQLMTIVVPMTLLSTLLLFSKPQVAGANRQPDLSAQSFAKVEN